MIGWRDNQNIIRIGGKSGKRNGCSRISWRRFDDINVFRIRFFQYFSAQMTVVNIPTTITLSAILRLRSTVISNKDLPSKCQGIV
jgi:hypothetical protein